MWFTPIKKEKKLRELIARVRPVLLANYEAFGVNRVIDKTELSRMHYCFSIGLNDITEKMKLPAKPVGFRVYESDKNGTVAIYQFDMDVSNSKTCRTYFGEKCFKYFDYTLKKLELGAHGDASGEIRYLRVSALNQEILWLHYAGKKPDKFALTEYNEDSKGLYTEKQFLKFLNIMKIKLGDLDKNKGA